MKKELEKYKVITRIPVQWGDMDSAQHVNNLLYLRWAESGRILYFEKIAMNTDFKGIGPILGWQDCKYIFPMTYPDTAIIGARLSEVMEDRFVMEVGVYSETHQRIAALSKQHIIPYDYKKLKKVSIPKAWLEGIERLEND